MRVPAEAALGVAKATLSFPGWKQGSVAPITFDVRIIDAGSGKSAAPAAAVPVKK